MTPSEYQQLLLICFLMIFVVAPTVIFFLWQGELSIKKMRKLAEELDQQQALNK